ncbi:MAG TPA: hypothetical protein VF815_45895 [Myxococcaceae bacterium]|jgi:hypothetical protein
MILQAGILRWLWLLGLGLLLGSCRKEETSLIVSIEFPPTLLMDQLLVAVTVGEENIGPHLLPDQPGRLLTNGDDFRVELPSAKGGEQASLRLEGLREGGSVALGTTTATVRLNQEVEITVELVPTSPPTNNTDGGTDGGTGGTDGGTGGTDGGTGGNPDAGFCPNCPDGCCVRGVCTTRTFNTCGTGGVACTACSSNTASTCSNEGFCACGPGPACDARLADRCLMGQCRCGNNNQCGFGQQCVQGTCVCNADSCSGCCSNNTCHPGTVKDRCGVNGDNCRKCDRACLNGGSCL